MKLRLLDVVSPPVEWYFGNTDENLVGIVILLIALLVLSVVLVNVFVLKKSFNRKNNDVDTQQPSEGDEYNG